MIKNWKLFLASAVLLAGCGGHDVPVDTTPSPAPDPLDAYRKQAVSWTPCSAEQLGDLQDRVAGLGNTLQCAHVLVPVDYANPGGETLTLSLMRVSAPDTANRQGSILINPGGPGADGLPFGVSTALILQDINPNSPGYTGVYQMGQRYDLVGFSPRGTANATQLNCTVPAPEKFVAFLGQDRTTANLNNAFYDTQLLADACKANPLTPFINTDATARDMDIIRSVLGDSKLNYLGYSYGTALGTWYARIFPQNVGRMLLDGVVDIERPLALSADVDQAPAAQVVLDQLIAPYAMTLANVIDVGTSVDEVRAIFPNAPIWAKEYASAALYDQLSARSSARDAVITLAAVRGVTAIMAATPTLNPAGLRARISQYAFSTDASTNAAARNSALQAAGVFENYIEGGLIPTPTPDVAAAVIAPQRAVNMVVKCNDAPVSQNLQDWVSLGDALVNAAPLYGGGTTANPCLNWGAPSVQKPPIAGAQAAPPMLMLQTEFDPKTPLAGAEKTLGYLPTASMIMVTNENTHTIFPSDSLACVNAPVGDYFMYGTRPPRYSECAGPTLVASASTASVKRSATPQFLHPDTTQELIEERRRMLQQ